MDVAVWAVVAGVVAWKFAGKAAQLVSGTFVALLGTVVKAAVLIAPLAAVADRLMPGHGGGLGVLWAALAVVVVAVGWWPAHVIRRELWPSQHRARGRAGAVVRWAAGFARALAAGVAEGIRRGDDDAQRVVDYAVHRVAAARVGAGRPRRAVGVPGVLPGGRGGAVRGEVGQAGPSGAVRGERGGRAGGGASGGVLGRLRPVGRAAAGPGSGGVDEELAALEEAGKSFRAAAEAAGIRV